MIAAQLVQGLVKLDILKIGILQLLQYSLV